MKLAYSNRAEAQLRLQNFDGAISDAESALELDPTHMKSMDRQRRAALGMGLYERATKATKAFTALWEQYPEEKSRLLDLLSRDCQEMRTASKGKENVGPVEIRRANYAGCRRGLFVTESVKTWTNLLTSNPMVVGRARNEQGEKDDGLWSLTFENCTRRVQASKGLRSIVGLGDVRLIYHAFTTNFDSSWGMFGPSYNEDAIVQLLQRVRASKRSMAQEYSLASRRNQEIEVPSVELFRPESNWVPPNASSLTVDVNLIFEIMSANAFETEPTKDCYSSANTWLRNDGRTERCAPLQGLWILPSFMNQSCAPNCKPEDARNVKCVRSVRNISCDEELTVPYFNVFASFEARQDQARGMSFTCKCQRCSLEERFKNVFSAISAEVDGLLPRSRDKCLSGTLAGGRYLVTIQLATVADRLEGLIASLGSEVTTWQQNWIRASLLDAYVAKYVVAAVCKQSASVRVETLTVMVETMISVFPSVEVETLAHLLFDEVKAKHSKKGRELMQGFLPKIFADKVRSTVWMLWSHKKPIFDFESFKF